jgi:hypothetical protein
MIRATLLPRPVKIARTTYRIAKIRPKRIAAPMPIAANVPSSPSDSVPRSVIA